MLWSIFVTYIITHRGLGGFSGLINGLIAAAFGALSVLMSEPTVKSNVKRTCMFVLSIATLHYNTIEYNTMLCTNLSENWTWVRVLDKGAPENQC